MTDPAQLTDLQHDNAALRQRVADLEQALAHTSQASQRAQEHYRALFEDAPVMYAVTRARPGGPIIIDCNLNFARTLGYTVDEVLGQPVADFYAPDSRAQLLGGGYARSLQRPLQAVDRQLLTRDNRIIHVLINARPVLDETGQPIGTHAIFIDVTARQQMEEALRESQSLYRSLVEVSPLNICRKDRAGRFTFANQRFLAETHITLAELLGKTDYDIHPPDLAEKYQQDDRAVMTSEQVTELIEERTLFTGGTIVVQSIKTPIYDGAGQVNGVQISFWDITARKQAEAALDRRARELAALYQISLSINAQTDLAALLQTIVQQQVELAGAKSGSLYLLEADGQALRKASTYPPSDTVGNILHVGEGVAGRVVETGQPFTVADYAAWPDKPAVYAHTTARRVLGVPLSIGARLIGAATVIDDESSEPFPAETLQLVSLFAAQAAVAIENARLLAAVQQHAATLEQRVAQRTAALQAANERLTELDRLKDEFLSRISHELRTPMAALKMTLDLLTMGKPEKRDEYIQRLKQSAERLQHLIEDILAFSQLQRDTGAMRLTWLDVNAWLEGHLTVWGKTCAARGLALRADLADLLPPAHADTDFMLQAMTRLLTNAVNYTHAGAVTLSTALRADDGRRWVTVSVTDTGPGITAADLPHIFERFYRGQAAADYKTPGTGIGLTITREIAHLMGGRLTVDTTPGVGSTFTVWLRSA